MYVINPHPGVFTRRRFNGRLCRALSNTKDDKDWSNDLRMILSLLVLDHLKNDSRSSAAKASE